MGYRLPTLNLVCNIFSGTTGNTPPTAPPTAPARLTNVPCQLTYGERVNGGATGGTSEPGIIVMGMNILLTKLTDVRGGQDNSTGYDIIECPAGSGRWYICWAVDDIGKGFTNEHRTAQVTALPFSWAPPYA